MPEETSGAAPGEEASPGGDAAADQPTTEIVPPPDPAATAGDEPTAAPAPEATSDEATIALTPEPTPDEATIALTAETTPDEATVALRPEPTGGEATVALPAGPPAIAQDTVAPPPAAPLPADGERPAAPHDPASATAVPVGAGLSRRRLLIGLSAAGGAALVAGAVAFRSASGGSPEAPASPSSTPRAIATPRVPENATVSPLPAAPVQHRPISTLAEYRRATGAAPFPTDAIALTIDDGPHPVWTPRILQLLDKHHVPALFCMIGNQVLGHEDVAKTVTKAGHQLANHTWSHPTKLAGKPEAVTQTEIRRAQNKIRKTTGYAPKLFRSPGGDWSPQLLHEVARAGLFPLDWTVDPRDWSRPGTPAIEHRLLQARPGQILLCHDGGGDRSQTYNALKVIVPALKARGLQFVAL